MDFEQRYYDYKARVDGYLVDAVRQTHPRSLYKPLTYVLAGGGKRIRPILVLLACEAVGGKAEKAIHAGAGIEILHNFTLVHDDIMDNAPSRRGHPTVHTRWDEHTAILVGDELLALAYRMLLRTESPRIRDIAAVFTEGVVEVCEGQAYDKEFEKRASVSVDDYLMMIRKKTGMMVSAATEIGAMIGGGTETEVQALKTYGELVGRAFQIQDDLLDVVGDEKKFGKSIGSDLREGKKTFLLLEAIRTARGKDRQTLRKIMANGRATKAMVRECRRIFRTTGAIDAAGQRIRADIAEAKRHVERLKPSEAREMLLWFTDMLLNRQY
jgi:geranylgeranyl diphosphate synthase type II